MLRLGVITEIGSDENLGRVRVHFDEVNMLSDWLPLPSSGTKKVKVWNPIELGSQVACLMDEQCEQGHISCVLWSKTDKPPSWAKDFTFGIEFEDGSIVYYDSKNKKLIIEAPDSDIDLTCKTLNVTGDVVVTGEVTAGVMKIPLTQHKHPTPAGVSGIPTP